MNNTKTLNSKSIIWTLTEWVFTLVFLTLGIMNLVLVHAVPGIFYLLLALVYLPLMNTIIKRNLGFSIPAVVKIIFAFVVLWATLAVGDLAEMYGF